MCHNFIRKEEKIQDYRPGSTEPTLLKTYEGIMFKQMSLFLEDIFSKHQLGF